MTSTMFKKQEIKIIYLLVNRHKPFLKASCDAFVHRTIPALQKQCLI